MSDQDNALARMARKDIDKASFLVIGGKAYPLTAEQQAQLDTHGGFTDENRYGAHYNDPYLRELGKHSMINDSSWQAALKDDRKTVLWSGGRILGGTAIGARRGGLQVA